MQNGADATHLSSHTWRDPKFFTKGPRGFAGVDWQGKLFMGVVSGVTMEELAGTLQKIGLKDAIALDGNASAGQETVFTGRLLVSYTEGRNETQTGDQDEYEAD